MFDYFVEAQEAEGIELIGEAIDVPEVLDYAGEVLTEVWPLLALAIGIPLAFYIARRVKGIISG